LKIPNGYQSVLAANIFCKEVVFLEKALNHRIQIQYR